MCCRFLLFKYHNLVSYFFLTIPRNSRPALWTGSSITRMGQLGTSPCHRLLGESPPDPRNLCHSVHHPVPLLPRHRSQTKKCHTQQSIWRSRDEQNHAPPSAKGIFAAPGTALYLVTYLRARGASGAQGWVLGAQPLGCVHLSQCCYSSSSRLHSMESSSK